MTRNLRISLCMLFAFAALAGCRREEAAAPAAPPPTTVAPASVATIATPAPATTAALLGVAASAAPGEHTDFDAKAFAGSFAAPGTRVSFDADGNYSMRVHAASANADLESDGTWTLEPDARHVLLDPNSKDEPDRRYEIASMDELRPDDGAAALHREGTH